MPRFSIIVPIYNVAGYVGECIESLLHQTFSDFEVVCVNDGSTDASPAVAKRAANGDGRFVFVDRENGGLSAARNTGLAAATGEYVCFLDSDDRYAACALERLDEALRSNDLDLLDFSATTFYETPDMRGVHEESYDYRDAVPGVHGGQDLFALYWQRRQFVSSACFHVMRRSLLEEAQLTFCEGLLHEDELFTPVLYAHAQRAAYLDEQLYERRVRAGSIMATPASMRRVTSLAAIAQMLHAWLIENADDLNPKFIDAFALDIAYVRDAAFRAASAVDPADLNVFLDGMSLRERAEFNLVARYDGLPAAERCRAAEQSRDYRVGHAALAVPRAMKGLLRAVKR